MTGEFIPTFPTTVSTVYSDYLWNTSLPQVLKRIAPDVKRVCCSPMAPSFMDWYVKLSFLLFRAQGGRYMLDRCDRPAIKSVMADLRLGMDTHDAWVKVGQLSLLLNRSLTLFRRMWRIVRIS